MKVLVEGIEQGAIEIELGLLPRLGESIRFLWARCRSGGRGRRCTSCD